MPRNESPENTIMKDVPPGDESGIYYILISGLPFGTIWQLLKDWLRQARCDVDHVEVFQKSTSGWVRLVGKNNFERALHHLQTVPYNNRLLLYLDKNRTESVKIMELIDDPPPQPRQGGSSQAMRPRGKMPVQHSRASCDQQYQEQACPQSTACTSDAAGPLTSTSASAGATPPTLHGALPETAGIPAESQIQYRAPTEVFGTGGWGLQYGSTYTPGYRSCERPANPAALDGAQSSNSRYPRIDSMGTKPPEPSSRAGTTTTSDASQKPSRAKDGRFKVHLLSLKHGASPQDVEGWVRSSMGEWASAMSRIDVPVDRQKGRFRGSGSITFFSSSAAKRAVEVLNKKLFFGRLVHARLADEGEKNRGRGARDMCCDSRQSGPAGHSLDNKGPGSAQQDTENKVDTKHSPPVIAHGTCYRPN